MSKLSALRRQIAALEAKASRLAKEELQVAVGKVRSLMSEFGVTIEHLTSSSASKAPRKSTKAPTKKAASKKTAPDARYQDPKTGRTWSGLGRAPGWIADAKNRADFLVNKTATAVAPASANPAARRTRAKKAVEVATAPAKKVTKAAKKKVTAVPKKAAAPSKRALAATKRAASKKVQSRKKVAKAAQAAPTVSSSPATE